MPKVKNKIQPTSNLIRETEWDNLTEGDDVKITSPRLEGKRGYKWVFRGRVVNPKTQTSWIEVYGGRNGYEAFHAFREDEVEPVKKKRTKTS